MTATRPAELAGRWYPSSAAACAKFLDEVKPIGGMPAARHAAIVPHAGWVYSGAVAWEVLASLAETHPSPDLVVVFGGHLSRRDPPRLLVEGAWETPFGPLAVAEELAQDIAMGLEGCDLENADDFFDDNAIEVIMPMVARLWPKAKVITMGVPPVEKASSMGDEVIDLARRRGYRDIVVIGSTDLTHYGPNYEFRPKGPGMRGHDWVKKENDPAFIRELESMDAQKALWVAERGRSACCPGAACAAIGAARRLGAKRGVLARHTTSWEVRPAEVEPQSFVGYAGIILGE